MSNAWWLAPARDVDQASRDHALARQQQLTKPTGSLGRLEDVAVQLAGLQGLLKPKVDEVWIAILPAITAWSLKGFRRTPRK